ncbi:Calx-beta domain-containing protein [Lentzea sp. NPDC051838]|uniref:Calx-beta domain-containing protein n=1 Tax=Lentzea sp. NPDC051838 TaxID=3154849 RepID=UPI0034344B2A
MVLLLLLLGIVPAHGAPDCNPPDCPVVVDALDGPVHESVGNYAAVVKLRNGAAKQDVQVSYKFVDGTAKQGEDYRAQSGAVVIKAGQDHAAIPYTVLRIGKEQKQFTLHLTEVKPGQIGKRVAVFTIAGRS